MGKKSRKVGQYRLDWPQIATLTTTNLQWTTWNSGIIGLASYILLWLKIDLISYKAKTMSDDLNQLIISNEVDSLYESIDSFNGRYIFFTHLDNTDAKWVIR